MSQTSPRQSCNRVHRFVRHRLLRLVVLLMIPAYGPTMALAQEHYRLEDQGPGFVKQPAPDPASPEGKIQTIRKAVAAERFDDAIDLADAWLEQYPNHPSGVEAYFLRGDAKSGNRDYYSALYDYEYVVRAYPGSEQFAAAMEREFQIARLYSHGLKRKFLGMPILDTSSEAEELFIRIQERAPGSEIGERASLELGEHYVRQGEIANAATSYDMFLINYPQSRRREYAMLRLIQANLAVFKGPRFDATSLVEAGQRLKMYQKEYPASADRLGAPGLLLRIDESLARKQYLTAGWYRKRGEAVSAVYMYRRVIKDYPRSAAAQDALTVLKELDQPVTDPRAGQDVAVKSGAPVIRLPEKDGTGDKPATPDARSPEDQNNKKAAPTNGQEAKP